MVGTGHEWWIHPSAYQIYPSKKITRRHRTLRSICCLCDQVSHSYNLLVKWLFCRKISKKQIRKGMVLLSGAEQPKSCWEFMAELLILNHPTTISKNYEAMIHCGAVRQTAKILEMSKEVLRTGDRDKIRFRFTRRPEYIVPNTRIGMYFLNICSFFCWSQSYALLNILKTEQILIFKN